MSASAEVAQMIRVECERSPAPAAAVSEMISSLDVHAGAWLGCDVEAEGLYQRASMGCAKPALRFQLDGYELRVLALTPIGAALVERVRPLAQFNSVAGGLSARFPGPSQGVHPVVGVLRAFLGLFSERCTELALFGAFSFDYHLLANGKALPDDGRRRMVLYFPERVLVAHKDAAEWVEFRFPELKPSADAVLATVDTVESDRQNDDLPPGGHAEAVRRGRARLLRGDLYSLVLSQTFRRRIAVRASEAFASLRNLNPYPAMFFVNLDGDEKLFGASPDLQVRADRDWVESAPVCGTFRRGTDPIDDADQARALLDSDKEDASLAACADSDRNDKAKVCEAGTVELVSHRRLHFFSTIIHTINHIRGRRKAGVDAFDILLAHANPATVTGLPKDDAVCAIGELEATWRGWYAGAVARLSSDGSAEVLTVLRAARVTGELAEVRTGGNLLVDSDPDKEEEETRLKAETMFRVLSGSSPCVPKRALSYDRRFNVSLDGPDDPMLLSLADCLETVGGEVSRNRGTDGDARIAVLSDGGNVASVSPTGQALRTVAVGGAALALITYDGGFATTLAEPRYARRIKAEPTPGSFAAGLGTLELGIYANQVFELTKLPVGWTVALASTEGWVIAAERRERRQIAILCRPDSVQSLKANAGRRLLRAALESLTDA